MKSDGRLVRASNRRIGRFFQAGFFFITTSASTPPPPPYQHPRKINRGGAAEIRRNRLALEREADQAHPGTLDRTLARPEELENTLGERVHHDVADAPRAARQDGRIALFAGARNEDERIFF